MAFDNVHTIYLYSVNMYRCYARKDGGAIIVLKSSRFKNVADSSIYISGC